MEKIFFQKYIPQETRHVIETLEKINNLNITEQCRNERYLHHYFTMNVQKECPIVYGNLTQSKLHPEWATLGKYKKMNKVYQVDENGTCGFIDFAVGDFKNPDLAIEFKHNKSWNFQSIVFDFMKLMDNKNNIKFAISFSIIYRQNELSYKLTTDEINKTVAEFTKRLGSNLDKNRPFLFWIIEIAPKVNQKKTWLCDNLNDRFNLSQC